MPALKGNQNAKGNKGGGRKKERHEKADYTRLVSQFYDEIEIEKLEKKIKAGKYSVEDMFHLNALKGGDEAVKIFQKIYPDRLESELSGRLDFKDVNKKDILDKVKGLLNAKGNKAGSRISAKDTARREESD